MRADKSGTRFFSQIALSQANPSPANHLKKPETRHTPRPTPTPTGISSSFTAAAHSSAHGLLPQAKLLPRNIRTDNAHTESTRTGNALTKAEDQQTTPLLHRRNSLTSVLAHTPKETWTAKNHKARQSQQIPETPSSPTNSHTNPRNTINQPEFLAFSLTDRLTDGSHPTQGTTSAFGTPSLVAAPFSPGMTATSPVQKSSSFPAALPNQTAESPSEQLIRVVEPLIQKRDGVFRAHLILQPDDLGTVDITVEISGDSMQVHFSAEMPETRKAIAASLPDLQQTLRQSRNQTQTDSAASSSGLDINLDNPDLDLTIEVHSTTPDMQKFQGEKFSAQDFSHRSPSQDASLHNSLTEGDSPHEQSPNEQSPSNSPDEHNSLDEHSQDEHSLKGEQHENPDMAARKQHLLAEGRGGRAPWPQNTTAHTLGKSNNARSSGAPHLDILV